MSGECAAARKRTFSGLRTVLFTSPNFRTTHNTSASLANEMFATRLGQRLGLPVPPVEVIEVSDWLIANTEDLKVEVGGLTAPCSSGRQLASQFPYNPLTAQIFDYLPAHYLERLANVRDFPRVLVLDKWTANCDGRQAIFARRTERRRFEATFIDQGYCFNAGEWTFPDLPLHGVYARNTVYAAVTGWESFEPTLTEAEEADIIDIWRCAEPIPPEWYGFEYQALHQLVEVLHTRRVMIRDLIGAFRHSSRNPFPNWTDK